MSADAVMLKIQRILTDEELAVRLVPDGLVVPFDSTAVFITVLEIRDSTLIRFTAPMVIGAEDTPELTRWVAVEGQEYYFGASAIRVQEGGLVDVVLDHTLLGDFLDREELMATLMALASTAEHLDDELTSTFGGRRLMED